LERGLAACELDPSLILVGRGSLPNSDGELELDAAMMDGADLSAGAVCALRGIIPAISVARLVLEKTRYVMIAGDQARRFAMEHGFKPQNLMTAESLEMYEDWLRHPVKPETDYPHSIPGAHGDTVTMLGCEEPGHVVAASSTSGLAWKMPGRVGDSPIIGAGIYADDEVGAAGATGYGEELWKACASFRTVEHIRRGMKPQEACEETIRHMLRRQPHSIELPTAVFACDTEGNYGAAVTTRQFTLWICQDGLIESRVYDALAL
jgi:N4-(beta-N-acetylglucosaminyl)-L-asparaginase